MRSSKSRQLKGPTRRKIFISLGMILIVLTSFFGGFFTQVALRGETEAVVSDIIHIMDEIGFVYDRGKDEYVKIDSDKISTAIALNFLDDYSEYYTEEEYEAVKEQKGGNYSGFGFNFLTDNIKSTQAGTNVINTVTCNSPAWKAGFKDGDKIVKVSYKDEDTIIENGKQLADFLELPFIGEEVKFTVERNGVELQDPIAIKKQNYTRCYVSYRDSEVSMYFSPDYNERVNSVADAKEMIVEIDEGNSLFAVDCNGDGIDRDVGYIKLYSFNGDAAEQFGAAIDYMIYERGRTRLLLDLCDNGGGSMDVLKEIAAYLMKADNGIYAKSTEKLDWSHKDDPDNKNYATSNYTIGRSKYNPLITRVSIIANRNTASAAECLLLAVENKDYGLRQYPIGANEYVDVYTRHNLVVVGSLNDNPNDDIPDGQMEYRTFGKGVMQTTYELNSGGALKITTAKLLGPWNDCIHKTGVTPTTEKNRAINYGVGISRAVEILTDASA